MPTHLDTYTIDTVTDTAYPRSTGRLVLACIKRIGYIREIVGNSPHIFFFSANRYTRGMHYTGSTPVEKPIKTMNVGGSISCQVV
jgi:hypothetical protein